MSADLPEDRPAEVLADPMQRAVHLAATTAQAGAGGPFGCVIVRDGRVVGEGANEVLRQQDPTAHAEIVAIRGACRTLGTPHLDGCVLYTTCEPCPMCLGAIHWARITEVHYALGRADAAALGFSDVDLHEEVCRPHSARRIRMVAAPHIGATGLMDLWRSIEGRSGYGPPATGVS
jgi:guanine deaminase